MTVFATHFHELTALEQNHSCAKNVHVTAIKPTGSTNLTFLYEVWYHQIIRTLCYFVQVSLLVRFSSWCWISG